MLEGINPGSVSLQRNGNDATLVIAESTPGAGDGGSILLKNELDDASGRGIEQIVFADGTVWTRADLRVKLLAQASTSGNDTIIGFNTADTLQGGAGDDLLSGMSGSDTYVYTRGDGNDVINDQSSSGTNSLVLHGVAPAELTVVRNGDGAILLIGAGGVDGRITIRGQFNGAGPISSIRFDDGTVWTAQTLSTIAVANDGSVLTHAGTSGVDTIIGTSDIDVIDGGAGNDTLRGEGGSDVYRWGAGSGNDTIIGNGSASDLTDLNPADVSFGRLGNDLYITVVATSEVLKVQSHFTGTSNGIEQIKFADNTTWNRDQIASAAWYVGSAGNDSIAGSSVSDTLKGNQGNDYLRGNGGPDTYVYSPGHGNDEIDDQSGSVSEVDTLKFENLNSNDVTLSRAGDHLYVGINPTGETIKIDYQFYSQTANWGVEQFQFANGETWNLATINANAWIRGTSGNDTLSGSNWNDTFKGGLGNDQFNSGAGSDTYIYALGDGNDYINDESGSTTDIDVLRLTDLNASDLTFSRVGVNLVATVNSNGQTITFDEQFYSQTANWGLERIEFANGETWNLATINANAAIRGTSGNDTISGTAWNDTIAGGAGNDTMSGGAGNDTFVFRANPGQDVVTDFTVGSDLLEFRDSNFVNAAAALAAATSSGSDTLITIDANNTVLLKNVSLANLHEADFHIV